MLKKPRFDRFLSNLMSFAWTLVKMRKNIRFSAALKCAWRTAKEELSEQALAFVTPEWDF